jgi:hypothetical protein
MPCTKQDCADLCGNPADRLVQSAPEADFVAPGEAVETSVRYPGADDQRVVDQPAIDDLARDRSTNGMIDEPFGCRTDSPIVSCAADECVC